MTQFETLLEKAEYNIYDTAVLEYLQSLPLYDKTKWFTKDTMIPCNYKWGKYRWDIKKLLSLYSIDSLELYTLLHILFLPCYVLDQPEPKDTIYITPLENGGYDLYIEYYDTGEIVHITLCIEDDGVVTLLGDLDFNQFEGEELDGTI